MPAHSKGNTLYRVLLPAAFLVFALLSNPTIAKADLDVNDTQSLNSGSISNNNMNIGVNSGQNGTFNHSGGTNTVTNNLIIGVSPGSTGAYNLTGGALSATDMYVGYAGTGIFNQTGGSNTVSTGLYLGNNAGGRGTYNLRGGALSTMDLYVGYAGNGTFNQTGGTNSVPYDIFLGAWFGGNGTYNLSGGALSGTNLYIGNFGNGAFNQAGGTNTISGDIYVGTPAGGTGTYTLSDGTLNVGTIHLVRGIFDQTGGRLNAASFIQEGGEVQGSLENRGTFTYQNGTFSGRLLNYGAIDLQTDFTAANGLANYSATPLIIDAGRTLTLNGAGLDNEGAFVLKGTLTGSGALLNNGSFIQQGGTVQRDLENRGAFTYQGGLFSGRLFNYGAVNLEADFTAADGLANYSATPLIIDAGRTLILNGQGLDNQGAFALNGTLTGSGTLLNNTTGIFQGTGTVNGSFVNRGTLRPGNSIGTINITGSFTQTSTGNLNIEVASATSYDKLVVTGTVSLAGTVTPVLTGRFSPTSQPLTFLTASGGVTGGFGNYSGNVTPVIAWGLDSDPNSLSLAFSTDYANAGLNLTANQRAIGATFNTLSNAPSSDMSSVITTIANLPTAAVVADSYTQLSAEKFSALSTLSFAGADLQKRILAGRIYNLRTTNPGLQTSGISGKSGVFFDPAGIVAGKGSTQDQTGYDFTIGGFTTGIDWRVRDDLLVGVATGYNHTDANFQNSGGSISGDTLPVSAYVAYLPGAFYACGSLGYSLNMFNMHRNILFSDINRTAKSSVSGDMLNAYAEAGYDFRTGSVTLTPLASLSYSSLWVNGFSEEDAGDLALKVSPQNAQSLQSGLGAKVSAPFHAGSLELVPRVFATWQHEFANNRRDLDARFSGGGPVFTFRTDSPDRDFGVFGADISMPVAQDLAVRFDYSVQAGAGGYTAHYLGADLKWMF